MQLHINKLSQLQSIQEKVLFKLKNIIPYCQKILNHTQFPGHLKEYAFYFGEVTYKLSNSKVLYKCKCDTCSSVYIGKTKQYLLVRQYKHLDLSVFTKKALKYYKKDAAGIRKHCYQNKNSCRVGNFEIVGTIVNVFHLKLKQSLLILKMKPLNIGQESMPLYLFDNDF